jgi:hypothetical protein
MHETRFRDRLVIHTYNALVGVAETSLVRRIRAWAEKTLGDAKVKSRVETAAFILKSGTVIATIACPSSVRLTLTGSSGRKLRRCGAINLKHDASQLFSFGNNDQFELPSEVYQAVITNEYRHS